MTTISSSLNKGEDGLAGINRSMLGQISGLLKHLTRAEFDTAIAAERTRIASNSVGVYQNGERLYIIGEEGYRVWSLASGGNDASNAALSNAKTVVFASGKSVVLTNDNNTATAVTGTPTGGIDGNVTVDYSTGKIYTKSGGSWAATSTLIPYSTTPITVSGVSGLGQVLSAVVAPGWGYTSLQWKRYDGITITDIPGATSLVYIQTTADVASGVSIYLVANGLTYLANGVTAAITTLLISGTPSTTANIGTAYNFVPSVSGGYGVKTFSLTGGPLPTGLSLNSSTGAITGTPTTAATYVGISVRVTDAQSSFADLTPFSITVSGATITIPTNSLFLDGNSILLNNAFIVLAASTIPDNSLMLNTSAILLNNNFITITTSTVPTGSILLNANAVLLNNNYTILA